jgi:hypothetical protein
VKAADRLMRIGTIKGHLRGGGRRRGSPACPVSHGGGPGTARSRGAKARVGVKGTRWPPLLLRRPGLAVKAQVHGDECEASKA